MNRRNLQILADFLKKFAAGETDVEAKFSMKNFSRRKGDYAADCGTVGCAVGFAPYAGIEKETTEDWFDYSERVFGMSKVECAWFWCFSCEWVWVDNTPLGAAKRIETLLNEGLPENWSDQMRGKIPLQYEL